MPRREPFTLGAILAGGESRRFGSPKAFAEWRGRPLIAWVADAHRLAVRESCIVANDADAFVGWGLPVVADLHPGRGPAAGLHAALEWAAARGAAGVWCTPCDAPLVDPALARTLIAASSLADAVLPKSDGPLGYEPLFGWYATRTAPLFATMLEEGAPSMRDVVARLPRVVFISHPASARAFHNVNTPADLLALERAEPIERDDEG